MKRLVLLSSLVGAVALADIAPPEPSAPPAPAAQPAAPAPAPAPAEPVVAAPAEPAAVAPAATPEAPAPAPQHPMGIEKAGPSGIIEGGWSYVFAAYGAGYVGIALYALSLVLRRQKPGATS